jgi:type II secretory pathway predicted ATPase ExeA
MYETFFGLRERPFELTPNPRFLLMTPTHREALANLQYGLSARKGLTVLIGEAGAGKTTLIRMALEEWGKAGHLVAHLSNPSLTRAEFFEYLSSAFDLGTGSSKTRFLGEFTALVTRRHEEGLITGLVIDEAQSLSDELLEEVRLLVNIETATEKLFQVLLVGQPELGTRLNQPGLRQIKQRIALRCTLATLDVRQVAAYVAGRIQIAGGVAAQVFTREAVMAIHLHSGGIPRVISVISDNALLAGFAAGTRPVTSAMVDGVCREFDIQRAAGSGDETLETASPSRVSAHPAPEHAGAAPRATRAVHRPGEHKAPAKDASEAGGLFQQYVAAGRRRFSFF